MGMLSQPKWQWRWGHQTQLFQFLIVWQWFGSKLLHFFQTQPHKWTFFGPKLSAHIFPATQAAFVTVMSFCGMKKKQDLGEDERAFLSKMAYMSASQLPCRVCDHLQSLQDSSFSIVSTKTHIELCWWSGSDLKRKFYFQMNTQEKTFFPLEPGPFPQFSGSMTEPHSFPSVLQLLSQRERLGYFLAFGLHQAWIAYTLLLALISLGSQPIFK